MLAKEEYVEQAYFFRIVADRLKETPMQDLLRLVKYELLASTNLPLAVDFLAAEICHSGMMAPAMQKMPHYFTPFQTYVIAEAEQERGRFDMNTAVRVLQFEAEYRSKHESKQGLFFYQFETLCRNRMNYDAGLKAMSADPLLDAPWRQWVLEVRRQVGLVELADLILLRSEYYVLQKRRVEGDYFEPDAPILFGEKEGRIAMANHQKDPLFLFAAMQRHLGYPPVPKPELPDPNVELLPQLLRRVERMEMRIKVLQEEARGGLDITKLYKDRNDINTDDLPKI